MSRTPPDGPALRKAVEKYRRDRKRAAAIEKTASAELAAEIRAAYANGDGMKKADIIRAIDHEWSRTWVDRACRGDEPDEKPDTA